MYSIVGATGHIGQRIVDRLLRAGKRVRAVAHDSARLRGLERRGAERWSGDLQDTDFVARAFADVEAVFVMIPPSYRAPNFRAYQNAIGQSLVAAIERCGIKHVVNLSSLGADATSGSGPILGLRDQEERLNRLAGVNVVHLRPTFFMENVTPAVPSAESPAVLRFVLRPDLKFPAIATRDIADVASERLLWLDFKGQSIRALLGERDLTMTEIARVLGQAIGRPALAYEQVSYEDARRSMTEMGCSADVARAMLEMLRSMNEGRLIAGTARTPESFTPTSIERFAAEFAVEYSVSARHAKAA